VFTAKTHNLCFIHDNIKFTFLGKLLNTQQISFSDCFGFGESGLVFVEHLSAGFAIH